MPEPRLVVAADPDELAARAAELVAAFVAERPDAALLVATGDTPMATYALLAERHRRGGLDTSQLRPVQLDEYLDVGPDDRRSLAGWMRRSFTAPLGIPDARVTWLEVHDDPERGCRAFDEAVGAGGGLDLAMLGLGPNGHLGFNEPPSHPDAPSRVVELTPESVASNATYWGGPDAVPRRAATAGMRLIMQTRSVLLLVSGARKRAILERTLHDPPGPELPASLLRLRDAVTVVCDRAALGDGRS